MKTIIYISGIISTILCVAFKSDTYAILAAIFLTGYTVINELQKKK